MNGYEWPEIDKVRGYIPILLWQRREEVVLQSPGDDDRDSYLLLLDRCKVARADLAPNPPSGVVAICWPTISMQVRLASSHID